MAVTTPGWVRATAIACGVAGALSSCGGTRESAVLTPNGYAAGKQLLAWRAGSGTLVTPGRVAAATNGLRQICRRLPRSPDAQVSAFHTECAETVAYLRAMRELSRCSPAGWGCAGRAASAALAHLGRIADASRSIRAHLRDGPCRSYLGVIARVDNAMRLGVAQLADAYRSRDRARSRRATAQLSVVARQANSVGGNAPKRFAVCAPKSR